MSEQLLQNAVQTMRDTYGSGIHIMALCGSDFMAWFQNTISNKYGLFTGELNLFGGKSIKGLNFTSYYYMDCVIHFKIYNGFNNTNWFNARSINNPAVYKYKSSCLLLNTEPVNTVKDGTQPFITRYCYGLGESAKDATLIPVEYGIDANGNVKTSNVTNANKS